LLPALGLFTTTMLVIGGVIGSGIFRKPGVMMGELGSPALLLAVWVLAGVITFLGVLTNAEISSQLPETGGQYVFFDRMFGPFVAFLYGWAAFAVIQTGAIAALAYVFSEYATQFMPLPELPASVAGWSLHLPFIGDITPLREFGVKCLAVTVVGILTGVNYLGVRFGGVTQNIFTLAKVAGVLVLAGLVFLPEAGGSVSNLTTATTTVRPQGMALLAAVVAALQGAFWGYEGWVKASFVAGEVREPQRIVPKATLLAMLIVTGVYLLMNLAYCWVLPADVMAASKLVAADAAERVFSGGGKWVAGLVMISTFGAINAVILASARVYFSMARRSVFPALLGQIHPRFKTPSASLLVQGLWCFVLVFSGTFDMLTNTLVFVGWMFYAAGAYGVFVLRRKEPDAARPFKVPGYPLLPGVFVVFAVVFLTVTIYNDVVAYRIALAAGKPALMNCAFGAFLVLLGTPIYFHYGSKREARKAPTPRSSTSRERMAAAMPHVSLHLPGTCPPARNERDITPTRG
jgi:APA family basic amino acid/polyamine antiporter